MQMSYTVSQQRHAVRGQLFFFFFFFLLLLWPWQGKEGKEGKGKRGCMGGNLPGGDSGSFPASPGLLGLEPRQRKLDHYLPVRAAPAPPRACRNRSAPGSSWNCKQQYPTAAE